MYVWGGDRDTVFQLCGRLTCPYWRKGLGPEWYDKARWFAERDRARRDQSNGQDVPE